MSSSVSTSASCRACNWGLSLLQVIVLNANDHGEGVLCHRPPSPHASCPRHECSDGTYISSGAELANERLVSLTAGSHNQRMPCICRSIAQLCKRKAGGRVHAIFGSLSARLKVRLQVAHLPYIPCCAVLPGSTQWAVWKLVTRDCADIHPVRAVSCPHLGNHISASVFTGIATKGSL